jgi:hypothetical protein
LAKQIPENAEVIVSQGVAGGFGARPLVYAVQEPGAVPVRAKDVFVVLVPAAGIESLPETSAWAVAAALASTPHARLVVAQNGVWAFEWHPVAKQSRLVFPAESSTVPAWLIAGAAGRAVTTGPPSRWGAVSAAAPGLVVDRDYWQEVPGLLDATFRYQSAGPLDLQVWDLTANVQLASMTTVPTSQLVTTLVPVDFSTYTPQSVYTGWGPFSIDKVAPPFGDQIELRVATLTGLPARVVSVGLVDLH